MTPANQVLLGGGIILVVLLIVALLKKEQSEGLKIFLFWMIVFAASFTTIFLAMDTIIKNQQSVTKGPVHWHADYEIYVCGKSVKEENLPHSDEQTSSFEFIPQAQAHEGETDEELDLVDPTGFSNRVGTSSFHEHGDGRIHVEGVVERLEDVSLGKFFGAIGGQLTQNFMRLPTNHGEIVIENGAPCPDGKAGLWQGFVYKTQGTIVTQEKLNNFVDYILSPYSTIPPGDCIILEFISEAKDRTEKICQFYQIAIDKGDAQYDE